MIKKGNNIRFGNAIFTVENIDNDMYLLKNQSNKTINWIEKNQLIEGIEKMVFDKMTLNESSGKKQMVFKNDYLTVQLTENDNHTDIEIITEEVYSKSYDYSLSRALYEFQKFFNYTNELTPYKLNKRGFKKRAL